MNWRLLILVALTALLAAQPGIRAEESSIVPTISTTASNLYPQVTCSTRDSGMCVDALQMAADTRDGLTPLLQLGPAWRFPVHIHIVTPDDPLAEKIHEERVSAVALDKTMEINAYVPSSDPDAFEFIQRQFVTALLWEKFFARTQKFDTHTRLDIVPLWLIEGLREWLNDDSARNRESVVRRAAQLHRAPSLHDIAAWQDLSSDRLTGLWQRSFCYYLVSSLTHTQTQRQNFQEWLASVSGPNPSSAKFLFPTETAWQRELLAAPARSRDLVYTWDETASELSADETLTLGADKGSKITTCPISEAPGLPLDPKLIEALQQKIFVLTALELRAHASWRPVIALYRFGLSALITDKKKDRAMQFLAQAKQRRDIEIDYHQKLTDYVNWFEVTHDFANGSSQFRSYFFTAHEVERAQANQPNPIRAKLLQVESQL